MGEGKDCLGITDKFSVCCSFNIFSKPPESSARGECGDGKEGGQKACTSVLG